MTRRGKYADRGYPLLFHDDGELFEALEETGDDLDRATVESLDDAAIRSWKSAFANGVRYVEIVEVKIDPKAFARQYQYHLRVWPR